MNKKIFLKAIATVMASSMINGYGYSGNYFRSDNDYNTITTDQNSKMVTAIFDKGTHTIVSSDRIINPVASYHDSFNNQIPFHAGYKHVETTIIYEGFDINLGRIYTYHSIFVNDESVVVDGYIDDLGNEMYNNFGTPINIGAKTNVLK